MIRRICDRCGRLEEDKDSFDFFTKVLCYDLCTQCNGEYLVLLDEFIHNKNQTIEENTNEQEKASNT